MSLRNELGEYTAKTQYHERAVKEMGGISPEYQAKMAKVLQAVDQQLFDNLGQFRGSSGVAVPYTFINLPQLYSELQPSLARDFAPQNGSTSRTNNRVFVVIPGISVYPSGHPFTAGDIVNDHVIRSLPAAAYSLRHNEPLRNDLVVSLGSPNGAGGQISPEWVQSLKNNGFETYGQFYGEMLRVLLEEEIAADNTKFILHGMSNGSPIAVSTARNLPELRGRMQVLLDNPVSHGSKRFWGVASRAVHFAMALPELALYDPFFNKGYKAGVEGEKRFLPFYEELLEEKGIDYDKSDTQKSLKGAAVQADIFNLIKGTDLDSGGMPVFIRQGLYDPFSINLPTLIRTKLQSLRGKNPVVDQSGVLNFPISSIHLIKRERAEKWAKAIDFAGI